jgi:hypothetical protein
LYLVVGLFLLLAVACAGKETTKVCPKTCFSLLQCCSLLPSCSATAPSLLIFQRPNRQPCATDVQQQETSTRKTSTVSLAPPADCKQNNQMSPTILHIRHTSASFMPTNVCSVRNQCFMQRDWPTNAKNADMST